MTCFRRNSLSKAIFSNQGNRIYPLRVSPINEAP